MITKALKNNQVIGDNEVILTDIEGLEAIKKNRFLILSRCNFSPFNRIFGLNLLISDLNFIDMERWIVFHITKKSF